LGPSRKPQGEGGREKTKARGQEEKVGGILVGSKKEKAKRHFAKIGDGRKNVNLGVVNLRHQLPEKGNVEVKTKVWILGQSKLESSLEVKEKSGAAPTCLSSEKGEVMAKKERCTCPEKNLARKLQREIDKIYGHTGTNEESAHRKVSPFLK